MNSPSSGSTVGKTFIVSGEANVFEANVSIAVEDSEGDAIYEGFTTADMPDVDEWGPFKTEVTLPDSVNDGDTLTVKAFDRSARDGAVQYENEAEVTFSSEKESEEVEENTVTIYFGNSELSDGSDCSEVFGVERTIPDTQAVATAAINELIEGPTSSEEETGYLTSLPEGLQLSSLRVEDDVAYADFNEVLNQGGGSCMMTGRTAQIEETLKQFPTVESVEITVNGESETIMQP